METGQRENRFFVIEGGYAPRDRRVARFTTSGPVRRKLPRVHVLVALRALSGCPAKYHVLDVDPKIGRPVALRASDRAMRPQQLEVRLRMVKRRQVLPCAGSMAGLACPGRRGACHRPELPSVRIVVACRAIQGCKMVDGGGRSHLSGRGLVTPVARRSHMRPGQRKLGILVPRECVSRRTETVFRVAAFALASVRWTGELA